MGKKPLTQGVVVAQQASRPGLSCPDPGLRTTSDGDGQRGPPTSAQTHPWQAHPFQGEEHPPMVATLTPWAGVIMGRSHRDGLDGLVEQAGQAL